MATAAERAARAQNAPAPDAPIDTKPADPATEDVKADAQPAVEAESEAPEAAEEDVRVDSTGRPKYAWEVDPTEQAGPAGDAARAAQESDYEEQD